MAAPPADPPVPVVGIDNVAAGRLAAKTLLARGYRRLAFLGGPKAATSTQDRAAGFVKELQAAQAEAARLDYAHAYSYDAGREAIGALLEEARLEAIFCGDDLICMGAMDAARAAGRAVPDDLGFLGFNDMAMARWAPYSLTTIRQPINDIIRRSVELMLELVEAPQATPDARRSSLVRSSSGRRCGRSRSRPPSAAMTSLAAAFSAGAVAPRISMRSKLRGCAAR